MAILADQIEVYIKNLLASSQTGIIELKRTDLAEMFLCVPSQINYVLSTRFNTQQGYIVESRRGGGGYLRIIKLSMNNDAEFQRLLAAAEGQQVSRQTGEILLQRLVDEEFISLREGLIIKAMIDDNVLKVADANSDLLRGNLLNALLVTLMRENFT